MTAQVARQRHLRFNQFYKVSAFVSRLWWVDTHSKNAWLHLINEWRNRRLPKTGRPMALSAEQSFKQSAANGCSEPLVPFDEKCRIRREGWKADFQRPAIHSSDGFWSRVVSARKCEGVFPVHYLNARVSADGLERPTRNPICAIGVLVFATSSLGLDMHQIVAVYSLRIETTDQLEETMHSKSTTWLNDITECLRIECPWQRSL